MKPGKLLLTLTLLLFNITGSAGNLPRIVVSIKPVHSIVSAILQGVNQPELLLDGFSSPHNYHLKPSDARRLAQADAIIWVGPALEGFLSKAIHHQLDKSMVITLLQNSGSQEHSRHDTDPHLWLNPRQVLVLINRLKQSLTLLMPQQADMISQNADQLRKRIQLLDQTIEDRFKGEKNISAITYHNAWGYFETRYGLKTQGVISMNMQQQPGANHLYKLQQLVKTGDIQCLLVEPQFKPRYLAALTGSSALRLVEADPLGANIKAGPDAYFKIMQHISLAFSQCAAD